MQLLSQNHNSILFCAAALTNCYGITTSLLWNHPDASLFNDGLHFRALVYLYLGENNRITRAAVTQSLGCARQKRL